MKFKTKLLGNLQMTILISLIHLNGKGNGLDIQNQTEKESGTRVSVGALYTTLKRLEEKGLIGKEKIPKRYMRGGRERSLYFITELGKQTVKSNIGYIVESFYGLLDSHVAKSPSFSQEELNGNFTPERRPWQTMVRVNKIDGNRIFVVIPGRGYDHETLIDKMNIPENIHKYLEFDFRFLADVNLGAKFKHDLYVTNFRKV